MADIGGGRPLRVCDLCGAVDDHPRQVIAGQVDDGTFRPSDGALDRVLAEAPEELRAELVRDLMDTSGSYRHYDCCHATGCTHPECAALAEGAAGLTGAGLLAHIVKLQEG